jgi:hypothetical protein
VVDFDYVAKSYYANTHKDAKGIRHGSGQNWSWGVPSDAEVWRSIEYEEVTYDLRGTTIIDARGQFANGTRWRYLGEFGESASYSDVDPETAKVLDQFLDGSCLKLR